MTHYNGTPISAEDISLPILEWERTYSSRGPLGYDANSEQEPHTEDVSAE